MRGQPDSRSRCAELSADAWLANHLWWGRPGQFFTLVLLGHLAVCEEGCPPALRTLAAQGGQHLTADSGEIGGEPGAPPAPCEAAGTWHHRGGLAGEEGAQG